MATPMDPFSGRYSMSSEAHPIPNWEKGSKVSLSSEEGNDYTEGYWDSSDLSGVSSGSSSSSDDEGGNRNLLQEEDAQEEHERSSPPASSSILADLDKTPKAASRTLRKVHRSSRSSKDSSMDAHHRDNNLVACAMASNDKGKGKAMNQDEQGAAADGKMHLQDIAPSSAPAGTSTTIMSSKHKTRRPRSQSNSSSKASLSPSFLAPVQLPQSAAPSSSSMLTFSKRAPGPAAQAMADLMQADPTHRASLSSSTLTSQPSSSLPQSSASLSSQSLLPASSLAAPGLSADAFAFPNSGRRSLLGSKPLSRTQAIASNRQLGRARTAPNNLFSESLPTNNLFSPGRSPLQRTSKGQDGDEDVCPASPEADVQTIIDRAFDDKKDSVDLSRRNLVRLPPIIFELSHFESLDLRTNSCSPTPIYLDLSNNYLNAAGLTPLLFNITNLRVLSLRSNQIESLPQSIGNLKNLKELLLFANKLTYLPAEILQLRLEKLQLGSNRFPIYTSREQTADEVGSKERDGNKVLAQKTPASEAGREKLNPAVRPVCEPRKLAFKVPSLLELCTRRLLEPVDWHRDSTNDASVITRAKLFTPGMVSASNGNIKRNFHAVKDKVLSPRTDVAPIPPHLLKPFLPLLQPLPHHLRCLLSPASSPTMESGTTSRLQSPMTPSPGIDSSGSRHSRSRSSVSSTPFEAIREIPQCSKCRTACSQFAETRMEWRHEVAGVVFGRADDPRCWIPVLWRGCSANCLDALGP